MLLGIQLSGMSCQDTRKVRTRIRQAGGIPNSNVHCRGLAVSAQRRLRPFVALDRDRSEGEALASRLGYFISGDCREIRVRPSTWPGGRPAFGR